MFTSSIRSLTVHLEQTQASFKHVKSIAILLRLYQRFDVNLQNRSLPRTDTSTNNKTQIFLKLLQMNDELKL